MSFDERSHSDHETLNESIIVETIIDEETPLLLPPTSYKHIYTQDDIDTLHKPHVQRTGSDDTLVGIAEGDPLLLKPSAPTITPLPWSQLLILLSFQLSEPLSSQIINPFVVELIRWTRITGGNESQTSFYVGIIESAFFAIQTFTIFRWNRLADDWGRKPVLLLGALGISLGMFAFGSSTTFWTIVLCRAFVGGLNGYIGVVKSMMAEITDATNAGVAYSYMPIAWSIGATMGPMLGGMLANPYHQFGGGSLSSFWSADWWKVHPYFLTCAVPASYSLLMVLASWMFLKETNPNFKETEAEKREAQSMTARPASIISRSSRTSTASTVNSLRTLFTSRVIIATLNYSLVSLIDMSFRSVRPSVFASPNGAGGLGLQPPTIGKMLACEGVANGLFQILFFKKIHDRLAGGNTRRLFLWCVPMSIPVFWMFPVMAKIAAWQGKEIEGGWRVFGGFAIQTVFFILFNMASGCIFIFVSASAPNRRSIGATNGIAQVAVSVVRTIGPAFVNTLFSITLRNRFHYDPESGASSASNWMGTGFGLDTLFIGLQSVSGSSIGTKPSGFFGNYLVWVVMTFLVIFAIGMGMLLPTRVWTPEDEESDDDVTEVDSLAEDQSAKHV